MKRLAQALAGIIAFSLLLCAQTPFTGRWLAQTAGPGGEMRETTYFLTQTGNSLTGAILNGYRTQRFSEGKVDGNQATWAVTTRFGDQERRVEYHARLDGDALIIAMPAGGRGGPGGQPGAGAGPPRDVTAKRVSNDGTVIGPFANLPKITLPALHTVKDNGLARTPPMGWNSWNRFRREVDDKTVREIADAVAANGMRDAGYIYINIDDTWEGERDKDGNIQANSKFPDMKALADYVHAKGLKLGIYSSPGPKTCAGFVGSYAHEAHDARTWAKWGIDDLKYDWCSASEMFQPSDMPAVYQIMGDALRASGRPIVFSLCQYGQEHVESWGAQVGGNLWRTTGDIRDTWQSVADIGFDRQVRLERSAGPGHWNDPDMLEIGNGGMNETEYRTHMILWSLLAAPLLAGNDLRTVAPPILDILTNREVIAVDQDKLGRQAVRLAKNGDLEVWARPLADGSQAVGLFNRGESVAVVKAAWSDLGLKGAQKVRDLWAHAGRGSFTGEYAAQVPAHGAVLVKVGQ